MLLFALLSLTYLVESKTKTNLNSVNPATSLFTNKIQTILQNMQSDEPIDASYKLFLPDTQILTINDRGYLDCTLIKDLKPNVTVPSFFPDKRYYTYPRVLNVTKYVTQKSVIVTTLTNGVNITSSLRQEFNQIKPCGCTVWCRADIPCTRSMNTGGDDTTPIEIDYLTGYDYSEPIEMYHLSVSYPHSFFVFGSITNCNPWSNISVLVAS